MTRTAALDETACVGNQRGSWRCFRHPPSSIGSSSLLDLPPSNGSCFFGPGSCPITMSLEPPTYLSSLQNNIRARPIPWEGAVRAGNITDDHLKKIKAVDKVRKEQRIQTIEADLPGYTSLLAGGSHGKSVLESASRRTDIVQYILVLASDLIQGMFRCLHSAFALQSLTNDARCSLSRRLPRFAP